MILHAACPAPPNARTLPPLPRVLPGAARMRGAEARNFASVSVKIGVRRCAGAQRGCAPLCSRVAQR